MSRAFEDAAHVETFKDVVRADMFNNDPNPYLRQPEVLDRWIIELTNIITSIDAQLTNANAEQSVEDDMLAAKRITHEQHAEMLKDRLAWRRRAMTLQRHARSRLTEAKACRREANINANVERSACYLAILAHRSAVLESGVDPEPYDIELWRTAGLDNEEDNVQ